MGLGFLAIVTPLALGLLAHFRAPDPRLTRLDTESQILARLDPTSEAAHAVQQVVDEHARQALEDLHLKRDWEGVAFFGIAYFVLATAGLIAYGHGALWSQALGVVLGALAIASLAMSLRQAQRRPRNRDGSRRTTS